MKTLITVIIIFALRFIQTFINQWQTFLTIDMKEKPFNNTLITILCVIEDLMYFATFGLIFLPQDETEVFSVKVLIGSAGYILATFISGLIWLKGKQKRRKRGEKKSKK